MNYTTSRPKAATVKGFGESTPINVSSGSFLYYLKEHCRKRIAQVSEAITAKQESKSAPQKGLSGYIARALDTQGFQAARIEMASALSRLRESQRRRLMGIANGLLYHWAVCFDIAHRTPEGIAIDRASLRHLDSEFRMECAVDYLASYLDAYWKTEDVPRGYSESAIKNSLNWMRDEGFVDWQDVAFTPGVKRPRIWNHIDVRGLLLLVEACELGLYEDWQRDEHSDYYGDEEFRPYLPYHKANFLRMLFNAVFPGWGYCREGQPDEQAPTTPAESETHQDVLLSADPDKAQFEVRRRVRIWEYLRDRHGEAHRLVQRTWARACDLADRIGVPMAAVEAMKSPPLTPAQLSALPF